MKKRNKPRKKAKEIIKKISLGIRERHLVNAIELERHLVSVIFEALKKNRKAKLSCMKIGQKFIRTVKINTIRLEQHLQKHLGIEKYKHSR